jgi:sporulation protein YlmC with PRC-barrel domain
MSKLDKDKKPLTKDRLVGMHVIDSDGNEAGTVQDIAFTVGKVGMMMIVETTSGESKEIPWDSIQAAGDYIILKPQAVSPQPVQTQTTVSQTVAQQPQQAQSQICPTCGGPLTYIPQYQRWYCYRDKKYV